MKRPLVLRTRNDNSIFGNLIVRRVTCANIQVKRFFFVIEHSFNSNFYTCFCFVHKRICENCDKKEFSSSLLHALIFYVFALTFCAIFSFVVFAVFIFIISGVFRFESFLIFFLTFFLFSVLCNLCLYVYVLHVHILLQIYYT